LDQSHQFSPFNRLYNHTRMSKFFNSLVSQFDLSKYRSSPSSEHKSRLSTSTESPSSSPSIPNIEINSKTLTVSLDRHIQQMTPLQRRRSKTATREMKEKRESLTIPVDTFTMNEGVTAQFPKIQSQNSKTMVIQTNDDENDVFSRMSNEEALNIMSRLPIEDIFNSALVPNKWRIIAVEDPACKRRIQRISERGFPASIRGELWTLLIGSTLRQLPRDASYEALKVVPSAFSDQIQRDVTRTFPTNFFFEFPEVRETLYHILNANANYNKDVGYCQGMGLVAALMMFHMPEEDAFWALSRISGATSPFNSMWQCELPGLTKCLSVFDVLLKAEFPDVYSHFEDECVEISSFATPWFLTGFIHNLPLEISIRIWDQYLVEGYTFIYTVALSIFRLCQDQLLKMNFDSLVMFLNMKDHQPVFTEEDLFATINTWKEQIRPIIVKAESEYVHRPRRCTM